MNINLIIAIGLAGICWLTAIAPGSKPGPACTGTAGRTGSYRIAVLPARVTILLNRKQAQHLSKAGLDSLRESSGYILQEMLFEALQQYRSNYPDSIWFLPVDSINFLLDREGLNYTNYGKLQKTDLASRLGVDALVISQATIKKTRRTEMSIARGMALGLWSSNNNIEITIRMQDQETGAISWNYQHRGRGVLFSTLNEQADFMMSHAARRFPFLK